MSDNANVTNVVVAGLGGQGVLRASDILADAVFRSECDIKKSEIHGMSQRGGSVTSDVRFGQNILSPMVPEGEADFLVVLTQDQIEVNCGQLREGGTLIEPGWIDEKALPHPRSLNVCLLGALSRYLDIPEPDWHAAVRANLPEKLHDMNVKAFAMWRAAAQER